MASTARWCLCVLLTVLVLSLLCIQPSAKAAAQEPSSDTGSRDDNSAVTSSESRSSLGGKLFTKSGWVGMLIALVAFVMLTLAIYDLLTLRRGVYLPTDRLSEISELSAKLDYDGVMVVCREDSSLICRVLAAGLSHRDRGYPQMVEAMEEVGRSEATRLHQSIGYLSLIGNIAPMMGLLGTVIGMMRSFHAVAEHAGTVQPGRLAEGIYEALTTTFMGLLVAIPALVLFVFFRNRVVNILDETAAVAEEIVFPLKEGDPVPKAQVVDNRNTVQVQGNRGHTGQSVNQTDQKRS